MEAMVIIMIWPFVGVEGAEIVALADPDESGRKKYMERTGAAKGYADYAEMLKIEKPDIAVITPHELNNHLPMVLAATENGAHSYVEKPLAATVDAVDEMIEACEKAGVLLVTALPWRGHPEIQKKGHSANQGRKNRRPTMGTDSRQLSKLGS